ncbi:hypothetical protein [Rubrivivax gelatinosus]|uniref:Secreted protein n=1 Tax=Rubrivivax gelatinosus (strain NBRC 100245 / IL144) TaxID=983917 RepID=I0HWL2_RUBGI|nr:hypothetical protein [Rubrivivax gelatinosus]BAL97399.1 hypothetical protein RGE_40630 [Rubrivivax gelatinosus IL144]
MSAAASPARRQWLRLAAALPALAAWPALAADAAADAASAPAEFSAAERALFVEPHLAGLKPPLELAYRFSRRGSLEPDLDDRVTLVLAANAAGGCCRAQARFLSGAEQFELPEVEDAQGNPVILYFLERDVREMQRRTKGQSGYFRKRIRMAVAQSATVRETMLPYAGRRVPAREVEIAPYVDDPLRARFQGLADKRYLFTLSPAVPGGVYAIATRVAGPAVGAPPLVAEELLADGATTTLARLGGLRPT